MTEGRLDLRGGAARGDRAFRVLAMGAAGLVLLVLGMIALVMTQRALPALGVMGLEFLTSTRWSPASGHYGALAFV